MKRQIFKAASLVIAFIGALIFFDSRTNQVNIDQTAEMEAASLPVFSFENGNSEINELYGYTAEMSCTKVRDTITPVNRNRKLSLMADTYGCPVDSIGYRVSSLDGSETIAEEEQIDLKEDEDTLTAQISLPEELQENQEYLLTLTAESSGRSVYYYTRIIYAPDWNVTACLTFAQNFHENTLNPEKEDYFKEYQTYDNSDSGNLYYVSLDSSANDITWDQLNPTQQTDSQISVKEITKYYTVIQLSCQVSADTGSGTTGAYRVQEYYRLRKSEDRMYVLDYERYTEKIIDPAEELLSTDGNFLLGIRSSEVEYLSNEAETVTAFVQDGELWSYNPAANTLVSVFSFKNGDISDSRANLLQHDIDIIRVDEVGSIDFFVSGYMNRGAHEGRTGIALYHYDALMYTIEEEAFFQADTSYEILRSEMGQLKYENDQGDIYLMLNDSLQKLDIAEGKTETIASDLAVDSYMVSGSGRFLAWMDTDSNGQTGVIHLLDMKNDKTFTVEEEGDSLDMIDFLGEDFVYGVIASETGTDGVNAAGGYREIYILNVSDQTVVKDYMPSGCLIGSVSAEENALKLSLIREENGKIISAGSDTIINRAQDEASVYTESIRVTGTGRQIQLVMSDTAEGTRSYLAAREIITDEGTEEDDNSELKLTGSDNNYYVYAWGKVQAICRSLPEAILTADDNKGAVLDEEQNYLWTRARRLTRGALDCRVINDADADADSLTKALSAILCYENIHTSAAELLADGGNLEEILQKQLDEKGLEGAECRLLTGCDTESMLYYISRGTPVLALTGSNSAVLLTGYNTYQVYYYDLDRKVDRYASYKEMDSMLEGGGYRFLTYVIPSRE